MKAFGSKKKGSQFEREVCKALSIWVSDRKRDDLFWRASLSGGRATQALKKGFLNLSQVGDISSIDKEGSWLTENFAIECKFVRDLNLTGLLVKKSGPLRKFWRQTVRQAKNVGRHPLLIAKQNNLPPLIFVRRPGLILLGLQPRHSLVSVFFPNFEIALLETLFEEAIPGEIWKSISGWPIYQVSNKGRLCRDETRLKGRGTGLRRFKRHYLKLDTTNVCLTYKGESKWFKPAQLVLRAFRGEPDPGMDLARHLDDLTWNNSLLNLAWGSYQDNYDDAVRNGRSGPGTPGARLRGEKLSGIPRPEYVRNKISRTKLRKRVRL